MRRQLLSKGGFGPPLPASRRRRQRSALTLIATLALALSTLIAVTAVSIGIAKANILVATQSGDGSLAVAFLLGCIIIGGIVGAVYRRRRQRPDEPA
jgi:hypothetical protein